jgi:hypothetical protein
VPNFGPIEDYRKMTWDELDYEKARLLAARLDWEHRDPHFNFELRLGLIGTLMNRWRGQHTKEEAEHFIACCDRAIDAMLGKDSPPPHTARRRKKTFASSTEEEQADER